MAPYGAIFFNLNTMCGIAGTYGINKPELTFRFLEAIKHTGPDEGPTLCGDKKVQIGEVRLSIVDVLHGQQPMVDEKTGNIVAQNGEIYNHQDLRKELEKLGYTFKTSCDTEVLLKGFTHYGPDFVKKLNGIFAISFYRKNDNTLFLFRDYFGVKPLHYISNRKTLRFSSEMKSFFTEYNKFKLNLDFIIFNKIFGCSLPEESLYKSIKTVKPSSYVSYKNGVLKEEAYVPEVFYPKASSFGEAKKIVANELNKSVNSQIPDEVNWAVLLSGGVDSSILSYLAKKNYKKRITTYSVCSSEVETEDFLNARLVSKFLESDHNEVRINTQDACNDFGDYLLTIEDINSRFLFYYYLAKALKGKVKVALCGEGSDELFAGYPVYQNLEEYIKSSDEKFKKYKKYLSQKMRFYISSIISDFRKYGFEYLYEFMIKYQMPYFQLNPVDKCSMRFGIELRVPYLSLNNSLAAMHYKKEWLRKGRIEKKLLRDAFKKSNLPTLNRKKVFAGTRTLPSFYQKMQEVSEKKFPSLKNKYKIVSQILDPKELYCLDLLNTKIREMKNKKFPVSIEAIS